MIGIHTSISHVYRRIIDWLLDVFNMCDLCIMNLDECDKEIRNLGSYLVSFPKTYWLTKAENIVYNKPV